MEHTVFKSSVLGEQIQTVGNLLYRKNSYLVVTGVVCRLSAAAWGTVDVWNCIEEVSHLEWYRGGEQMIGHQIRETGCGLNRL
jgi:hypothetical protein